MYVAWVHARQGACLSVCRVGCLSLYLQLAFGGGAGERHVPAVYQSRASSSSRRRALVMASRQTRQAPRRRDRFTFLSFTNGRLPPSPPHCRPPPLRKDHARSNVSYICEMASLFTSPSPPSHSAAGRTVRRRMGKTEDRAIDGAQDAALHQGGQGGDELECHLLFI